MRALAVLRFGAAAAIHDLPVPAADGVCVIRETFAGVNPLDYSLIDRLTAASAFPFVVGVDFAGVVEQVPAGEKDLHVGDRVFGSVRGHGTYAEHTAVARGARAEPLALIPDAVTDQQAAALPVAGSAALGSLNQLGVTAGQRVVVMGAAGGVGGYAVQIALSLGARVIGTVRGDTGEAGRLGAEEVYDTQAGDVIEELRAAHPDGVDAILDLVSGPDAIRRDAEILRPGGRLVSTTHAADEKWFAARQISAHNLSAPANPMLSAPGLAELARMLADGTITTRISSTVELDDAAVTLGKLRDGKLHGKAVIRV